MSTRNENRRRWRWWQSQIIIIFYLSHERQRPKNKIKMITLCYHLRVWEEWEQEKEAKTTTFIDCCCFLSFTRTMKAREKKHKNDDYVSSFSCLRRMRIRGGKEDDDHRSSLSSIFHKSVKDQGKKTWRRQLCAIIFLSKRNKNRRRRWRWNDHKLLSSTIFH